MIHKRLLPKSREYLLRISQPAMNKWTRATVMVLMGVAIAISSPLLPINPKIRRVIALDLPQPRLPAAQLTGRDYNQLRDLLAANQWLAADDATDRLMLKIAGQQKSGILTQQDIKQFPCNDLRAINRLWVTYSNGRFGFVPQDQIWDSVGGLDEQDPTLTKYGDLERLRNFKAQVQWDNTWRGSDPTTAPAGHLPKIVIDIDIPGPVRKWPLAYEPSIRKCFQDNSYPRNPLRMW